MNFLRRMKLKLVILFFSLLSLKISAFAQTPSWHWARAGIPDQGTVDPKGISTDSFGNVYAIGVPVALTNITFENTILPTDTMFLVKYNKHGKLIWAKHQPYNFNPKAFSTDAAGNSYVTGVFIDTVTVGSSTLICNGTKDIFVAKFDSAGNALWARRAGGPGLPSFPLYNSVEDQGNSIGVDDTGNCYVGGVFFISNSPTSTYNYVTFDTITYSLPASMTRNKAYGFLAKYNAAGQIQWMRRIEAAKTEEAVKDISVSSQGNIFITGTLYGTLRFNNLPTLTSNGSDDVYFARFDPNGNPVWAKSFGGSDIEVINAIAVDKQEQCYLTGYFYSPNLPVGAFNLTGSSQRGTVFVAKSTSSGNIAWAAQNTGSGSIGDTNIALDSAGNAYISASFTGNVTIGQQTISASNVAFGSPLVSKWNNAGTLLWAITAQGKGIVNKIAVDKVTGDGYLSGVFSGSTGFGSHIVSAPGSGIYIAKFSSNSPTGITEAFSNKLSVYPNPAQNMVYLNLPEAKGTIQIHLTDLQGKTVLSRTLPASANLQLALPELAKGMYILKAEGGKQIYLQKIVIQ
jgi:hypothetical protein